MGSRSKNSEMLSYGGHLKLLRHALFRILGVALVFTILIFYFKDPIWHFMLAPSEWDFVTYRWIERFIQTIGFSDFHFNEYHVDLIATELSSQFMTHITTAIYLGLLATSPYILFEIARFVSPALYDNERKYSAPVILIVYILFIIGLLMNYFILFPISFRFLGTYSVSERIHSAITLSSYISTFTTLSIVMGLIFQLPVISFFLAKMGIISSSMLIQYRKHSFVAILIIAAIITPPDVMTLLLVTLPLYLLFELSIKVTKLCEKTTTSTPTSPTT